MKDVLQRSLRKSLVAGSPIVIDNKRRPAATPPVVSAMAVANDSCRVPLRSILHNTGSSDVIMYDTVSSEHQRETDSGSKKKMTRYIITH